MQKGALEAACPWVLENVEALLRRREQKPMGEPPVEQKLAWLQERFGERAPKDKETLKMDYEGRPYEFKAGCFWNNIQRNWTGGRSCMTRLDCAQRSALEAACSWVRENVEALLRKREQKNAVRPST